MKQEILVLAGCMAAIAPSTSIADILPENFVGLSLGEIRTSSFLNQPFKGVIPFLFSSYENSKNLTVRLAPETIFNKIGAKKHSILDNLNFQIIQQNNKPVILISSDQPIQLPFLNIVLEIQGPQGSVYQDYTVLLDPVSKQQSTLKIDHTDVNPSKIVKRFDSGLSSEKLLEVNDKTSLAKQSSNTLSSKTSTSSSQSLKYRVKTGDSLSKIVQKQNTQNTSVKTMSRLIFQKNPTAFIRGDVNRIKKGALLSLPSKSEINGFELVREENIKTTVTPATPAINKVTTEVNVKLNEKSIKTTGQKLYTVAKGDSLSKITKKFVTKDISFTKLMNAIYNNNPTAFVDKSKNRIKAGSELNIPIFASEQKSIVQDTSPSQIPLADSVVVPSRKAKNLQTLGEMKKTIKLQYNQYRVERGDTLSYITKNLGYREVPFAKMLKAIYINNPEVFIDGDITKLSIGSVITLPPLSNFQSGFVQSGSNTNLKKVTDLNNSVATAPIILNSTKAAPTDLIKRIRELRKELKKSQENLSEMKNRLNQKELILLQKDIELDSLNNTLAKLGGNASPKVAATATAAVAVKQVIAETPPIRKNDRPKTKGEIAKLKRDLLVREARISKQLKKIKVLKDKTLSPNKTLSNTSSQKQFKTYAESSLVSFTKTNYAYLTIALLLGLLLIRYRRELYRYTYSAIKYDEATYYPLPDADKYELKEKNISYHDPKMDEDTSNYEFLTDEAAQPKVLIDPVLTEATQDIFTNDEEAKQIEDCEHLVTELFDDLEGNSGFQNNTEWQNIEAVCDNYIEKIKDTDNTMILNENGILVEEATDFNHMMSDLLESLDKVDKRVKKSNIADENLSNLLENTQTEFTETRNQA